MQVAAGIIIFLLILGAAAWLMKAHGPVPTVDDDDGSGPQTDAGAPEGGTPAAPPAPGDGPTTQDTGGGSVPTKPV